MLYVDHPAFCGANLATNGCLNLAGQAVRPVATHRTNPVDFKVEQRCRRHPATLPNSTRVWVDPPIARAHTAVASLQLRHCNASCEVRLSSDRPIPSALHWLAVQVYVYPSD